jgi:nicotinamide riboside transporter PnuC
MKAEHLSYLLSVLSLTSLWLMGNKSVWGIVIGLVNQILWIVYALMLKQYGLLIGVFAYTIIHIRNLKKWTKEEL